MTKIDKIIEGVNVSIQSLKLVSILQLCLQIGFPSETSTSTGLSRRNKVAWPPRRPTIVCFNIHLAATYLSTPSAFMQLVNHSHIIRRFLSHVFSWT